MSEPRRRDDSSSPEPSRADSPDGRRGLAEAIVRRQQVVGDDGTPNSSLVRVWLDDGTQLLLKRFDPAGDLGTAITGSSIPADAVLWHSGVLDRLPPAFGHAVRGIWLEDGAWVLAMSDLTGRLLTAGSRITREQFRTAIWAATIMHGVCSTIPLPTLWKAEKRVGLCAPQVMSNYLDSDDPLPRRCMQGWEVWDDLAPRDVKDAIARIHADPSLLTTPLGRLGPVTLLHGSYGMDNLAVDRDRVVATNWGLATIGPPVLDLVSFLVRCATRVSATPDELLADLRALDLDAFNEELLLVGLVFGAVDMGWKLGLDVASDPTPAARASLDWWIGATRGGLATGLLG